MNHELPLFFIHSGNQEYLSLTIAQAERTNRCVYLLGDDSNRHIANHWADMSQFLLGPWDRFKELYVHMSSNPYEFELNCFRRFFATYEFAKSKGFQAFMMLDSDCFSYADFSELSLDSFDAGLSMPAEQSNFIWTASPHGSYWTLPALKDFLDYLLDTYKHDRSKLEEKWAFHQTNHIRGGICDMTLLYLWATAGRGFRILNTTLGLDGGVFDHFLSVTEGYTAGEFPVGAFCNMKRVKFHQGKAYFRKKDGTWMRTYTIHAQGKSKIYIPLLAKQVSCPGRYLFVKALNMCLRILKKLRGLWR